MLVWLLITLIGTVLGVTSRIVVFRDLQDLMISFSAVGAWLLSVVLFINAGADRLFIGMPVPVLGAVICTLLLLTFVYMRSRSDNVSVASTLLVVVTKLPYAVLVPLLAISAVAPTGKTASKRASKRAQSLLALALLAPLIIALTRDKDALSKLRRGGW